MMPARPALRRILGPLAQAWAKLVQHKRDGHHEQRKEAEEGRRPARAEGVVHLRRKEREARAKPRAHDGVGGERARGDEEVRVDDVVEEPEEDPDDAEPERRRDFQGAYGVLHVVQDVVDVRPSSIRIQDFERRGGILKQTRQSESQSA